MSPTVVADANVTCLAALVEGCAGEARGRRGGDAAAAKCEGGTGASSRRIREHVASCARATRNETTLATTTNQYATWQF